MYPVWCRVLTPSPLVSRLPSGLPSRTIGQTVSFYPGFVFSVFLITGPPNGPVLFCSLASLVVCNATGGRAGRPPGAWAVGRQTLHGGPVGYLPLGRHRFRCCCRALD